LVEILHAENVLARRYFYPGCHRMEPYRSYFPHASLLLPETERLVRTVLQLCTGTAVGKGEIAQICHILELVVTNGAEVKRRMDRTNTDTWPR
jgi:dTDP-4-amino-4,6-dideoxygalactose transaminase